VESELDNIGCIDVTVDGANNVAPEKEKKAYHLIVRYLSEEVLGYLSNVIKTDEKGKGSIAWNLLKSKFAGNTTHAKSVAFNNLNQIKFRGATEFVNDVRGAISRLRATGLNMDSECLSLTILQKLPRAYESLVRIISQMEPIPNEEEVLKKIEKDQLQFSTKEGNIEALFTKKPYKPTKFNKNKRVKCYQCNKLGHLAKDCWSNKKANYHADKSSIKPKKKAYMANQDDGYEEVTSLMAENANINDNMDIDEEEGFKRTMSPTEPEYPDLESGYEADVSKCFHSDSVDKDIIKVVNHGLLLDTDRGSGGILVDSGCTDHMFNQRKFFQNFVVCTGSVHIGEKGRSIKIEGKGCVRLVRNNNKIIELKQVYFVPELPYNLLSLSSMWDQGIQIENCGKTFHMKKDNQVVFDGEVKFKLLHANLKPIEASVYSSIMHRRTGHKFTDENCESCKYGRMTRNRFSKHRHRTVNPGEEFSIDLAGPFSPESLGGARYFINLVDTASIYYWA